MKGSIQEVLESDGTYQRLFCSRKEYLVCEIGEVVEGINVVERRLDDKTHAVLKRSDLEYEIMHQDARPG